MTYRSHQFDGRTIAVVPGNRDQFPGPPSLSRLCGWVGLAAFTVFLLIGIAGRGAGDPARLASGAAVALAGAAPVFLARSRFALGFAAVATAGVAVMGNHEPRDAVWFAVLVLGAWCVLSAGLRVGLTYATGTVFLFSAEYYFGRNVGWASWAAGMIVVVLIAALVREQLVLVAQLRAAQADLAERSRAEERSRIARELHDVIAHTLTVSLLHITSARLAVEHDPADAQRALLEAERLGRQSLNEVRATMGLLRTGDVDALAAPVPGVEQLTELVRQVRSAGADVSLVVEGEVGTLPVTTSSTIYRIVQEALTNAAKHAPALAVAVCLVVNGTRADVTVESNGPPTGGSGMGLAGMKERAEALGGTCTAGPGGRGWLVKASLPYETAAGPGTA